MSKFKGVIIEGISTAGKTTMLKMLKMLQANDKHAERSVIALSEHFSQVLHRMNGNLVNLSLNEHFEKLNDIVNILQRFDEWERKLCHQNRSKGLFYILERFHLNHRLAFPNFQEDKLEKLEHQLREMGAKCVLLTISPEHIIERKISREPERWIDLTKKERNSIIESMIEEQNKFRQLAKKSLIPTIEINTDAKDWEAFAREIYPFILEEE